MILLINKLVYPEYSSEFKLNIRNKFAIGSRIPIIKHDDINNIASIAKGLKYLKLLVFTFLVFLFFKPPTIANMINENTNNADQLEIKSQKVYNPPTPVP